LLSWAEVFAAQNVIAVKAKMKNLFFMKFRMECLRRRNALVTSQDVIWSVKSILIASFGHENETTYFI
jgi:Holliday junction resolvase